MTVVYIIVGLCIIAIMVMFGPLIIAISIVCAIIFTLYYTNTEEYKTKSSMKEENEKYVIIKGKVSKSKETWGDFNKNLMVLENSKNKTLQELKEIK